MHVRNSVLLGGVETSLGAWLEHFDRSRFDVRLVCFRNPDDSQAPFVRYLAQREQPVSLLPWGRSRPLPRAVRAVLREIRAHPTHVIHSHDARSDVVALLAARIAGIPAVATMHAWLQSTRRVRLLEAMDALALRRFDRVINVSEATRRETIRRGAPAERTVTLYTGIDPRPFQRPLDREAIRARFGVDADELVLGNLARLFPEKGQDVLLRAMAVLCARHPRLRLFIVGEGPRKEPLRALAAELGVAGRVTFLGFQDDLPATLALLDVLVMPSFAEGMPQTIYSAMAMGLPIVASEVAGIGEVLSDDRSALLVPPGDVERLVTALERMIGDEELRSTLAAEARRDLAARFTVERSAHGMETIYRELAEELVAPR